MNKKELLARIGQAYDEQSAVLELHGMGASTLPPEISQLKNLEELNIYNTTLVEFPKEIFQLTNLVSLQLFNVNLTVLPPEISKLRNLVNLDLQRNSLKSLPPEIGHLEHLELLFLDDNEISKLPSEIRKLPKLEHISLLGNNFMDATSEHFMESDSYQNFKEDRKYRKAANLPDDTFDIYTLSDSWFKANDRNPGHIFHKLMLLGAFE